MPQRRAVVDANDTGCCSRRAIAGSAKSGNEPCKGELAVDEDRRGEDAQDESDSRLKPEDCKDATETP